jgi:RNA polymerase sigma-70 factor (ECF subfamily)
METRESQELAAYWTAAQRTVGAFIGTLVPDFHQAEEVLQRVAMVLVQKFADYDRRQPFAAWAIGIAKYEVLYYRRQHSADRQLFNDQMLDKIAASYQRLSSELSPVNEALHECLKQITGRARQALELRYAKDLKPAQVAQEMGLTGGAVRMLLLRVRTALRDCIQRRLKAAGGSL